MKVSMEQAAYIIGKTKKTIYNHKDKNKFSYELDNDGKAVVDISELLRVYGDSKDIVTRIEGLSDINSSEKETSSVITPDYTTPVKTTKIDKQIENSKIDIIKLEANLEKEKELRRMVEEQNDYFKEALTKSQETANKITLLLEDKTGQGSNDDWKKSLKAMEARISNQEKAEKERADRENKIMRQNQVLRRKLEEEKNKSFWQKLFG